MASLIVDHNEIMAMDRLPKDVKNKLRKIIEIAHKSVMYCHYITDSEAVFIFIKTSGADVNITIPLEHPNYKVIFNFICRQILRRNLSFGMKITALNKLGEKFLEMLVSGEFEKKFKISEDILFDIEQVDNPEQTD